jgi:phosphoglycerate dehydrogenase-like enzyme
MPDTLPASEMLPPDRPLWDHPDATVMPHVARPTVSQFVT